MADVAGAGPDESLISVDQRFNPSEACESQTGPVLGFLSYLLLKPFRGLSVDPCIACNRRSKTPACSTAGDTACTDAPIQETKSAGFSTASGENVVGLWLLRPTRPPKSSHG